MAGGTASTNLSNQLKILSLVGTAGDLSDAELLRRFLGGSEEVSKAALAVVADRHGPMVLRACRHILVDAHDAEDAFQATFLILARKAGSVRKAESVAGWLHGVAIRVALRARADAARRRIHERLGGIAKIMNHEPEGDGRDSWRELHEEIARLPGRYREPVVLCYLEGLSAEAAATRIGCPRGTVLSRLSRARERLKGRLIRRGLAAPAAFVAATTAPRMANAALPAGPIDAAIRPAIHSAIFRETRSGPASAVSLARKVMHSMMIDRLKTLGAAAVALGIVGFGAGSLVRSEPGAAPPQRAEAPAKTEESATVARRADVGIDDLIEATGLDLYKFQLDFAKGQRFRVVYRFSESKDKSRILHDFPLQATADGPVTVQIGFLRSDRKLAGFLMSDEKQAEYRVALTGCNQSGYATYVENPLADLEPARRGLIAARSGLTLKGKEEGETILLRVVAQGNTTRGIDMEGYPRGEVLVVKER